jgi:hypothetical protein
VRNELKANRTAAKIPARRPARLHPVHIATGIDASPSTSERAWVALSPEPNTLIQMCSNR